MKNGNAQIQSRFQRGPAGWLAAGGLVTALAIGAPGSVAAQDTTAQQDTMQSAARSDTTGTDSTRWGYDVERNAGAQNPPGYRGMERPAGIIDSAGPDSVAQADATSRTSQLQRQDSLGQPNQNPPGYRGMERPVGTDSSMGQSTDTAAAGVTAQQPGARKKAAVTGKKAKSTQKAKRDTTSQDSTRWGHNADPDPDVQNPPGYRGMERPAGLDSTLDSAKQNQSGAEARRDSIDIVHRQREVPPGMGHQPPPYPADSEQVWVEQRPSGDSVDVNVVGKRAAETPQESPQD